MSAAAQAGTNASQGLGLGGETRRSRWLPAAAAALALTWAGLFPREAWAGFTEVAPEGVVLVDESLILSQVSHAYDNHGNKGPLIDPIVRFEPGGSQQGIITPKAQSTYEVLLTMIQVGLLPDLTGALAIPVILANTVEPNLEWTPGDYQWSLGRAYSEEDFWAWAASMGQPKPGDWKGNEGVLADIVLATRYRFSRWIEPMEKLGLAGAVTVFGAIPTGTAPDPEEIVAAGTTSWDLHAQGELGFHLAFDKTFEESLDGRAALGLDLFYEFLFEHEYRTPRGETHPLLLNFEPYVGPTYTLDPGDFSGASVQLDLVPWKGPAWGTWVSGGSEDRAAELPPLVTVSARYTFTYLGQSDWESDSALWDWDREKLWRPGYKNTVAGTLVASLLRLGVPAQPYFSYRTQSLIPGKNSRAVDAMTFGVRVPVPLW